MARPCAFNKEELLAYLDGLASIGEAVPSCAALRKKFGGGSYTTLTKIVAEWKQKSNPNTSEIEVLPTVRKDLKEKELARQADEAVWTFQAAITEALKNYRKDEEARFKKLKDQIAALNKENDELRRQLKEERVRRIREKRDNELASSLNEVQAEMQALKERMFEFIELNEKSEKEEK